MCLSELTDFEVNKTIEVFRKVWNSFDDLRKLNDDSLKGN